MIVHCCHIHPRDAHFAAFHVRTYLTFCNAVVVAVDSDPSFGETLKAIDPQRVHVVDSATQPGVAEPDLGPIRQAAMDRAMQLNPTMIVFGDADEVPTSGVAEWLQNIGASRHQKIGEPSRFYARWVNLWGDYRHAIGGGSAWSFESPTGNRKCLAMRPLPAWMPEMRYASSWHGGMEPGRPSGGPMPTNGNGALAESVGLLHLKYGSETWPDRPEAKLSRHRMEEMLRGGRIVEVPAEWLWEGMPR